MTDRDLARKLLAHLRLMPDATPTEALAVFRRRLVEAGACEARKALIST